MIVPDANLLLYSVNYEAPLHKSAKSWVQTILTGSETIGFAWISLIAFVRVSTNAIFPQPLPVRKALDQIDRWLEQPSAVILHPGPRHSRILRELLSPLGTAGNLTSDAHLAALAIEHNAELCSADSDFARFAGLRWRNPLAEK
jgi:uncharacterized protein